MLVLYRFKIICFVTFICLLVSFQTSEDQIFLSENEWVETNLEKLTLEERIGQLFIANYSSSNSKNSLKKLKKLLNENKVGGVSFSGFLVEELKSKIDSVNSYSSKTPLFIGFEDKLEAFSSNIDSLILPQKLSLAVANDLSASRNYQKTAIQFYRNLGLDIEFKFNVNIDNENKTLYADALGTNPLEVSNIIKGILQVNKTENFTSSIGLFPGYENINNKGLKLNLTAPKSFDAVDILTYRQAIKEGVNLIHVGNIGVNAIDSTLTPLTISDSTNKYFREHLKFDGLLVTDNLSSESLKQFGKEHEIALLAFKSGMNFLYGVNNIEKAIKTIELAALNGEIDIEDLNNRVRTVLRFKYNKLINQNHKRLTEDEFNWGKKAVYEKSFVVLKNEQMFPFGDLTKRYLHISIGAHGQSFSCGLNRFKKLNHYDFYDFQEAREMLSDSIKNYDNVLFSIHKNTIESSDYLFFQKWLDEFPEDVKKGIVAFSNEENLKNNQDFMFGDGVVYAFENNTIIQEQISQFIFGAIPSNSTLPFSYNNKLKKGFGVNVEYGGRPKFASLVELNMVESDLSKIDSIVDKSIKGKAFPGCQIFISVKGKIIYNKSFGKPTYCDSNFVSNDKLYDIASITKIAASTLALIYLESQGRFDISKNLEDYIPELVNNTNMQHICLKDMMAHQAGLQSWIPFYYKTVKDGKLDTTIYSRFQKKGYSTKVMDDIWILDSYTDTIYNRILKSKLKEKSYKYSDLGYYFVKKIVEKITQLPYDKFLQDSIYKPMGLSNMTYNPLVYYDLAEIIPTEQDKAFRGKLVHGYVHDPGAAMLGGVGGHAGLFSTATDLGSLMHLFMNKGNYGGVQYLSPEIVKKYTSCHFCTTNRRGFGFDRPTKNGGGTCDKVCSQSSYGHSGFTGTIAWNDPKHEITYVFLSNRVYPDAENWKIVKENIRTNIQHVIYDAITASQLRQ